ncbi:MAG: aminoacyl--tRNA ligase-related protein [Candidatus Paceibacterota bacterium]|jgi:prolyl-tRNA synthetase|nr:His/Gly/Thr/Pro-type tRNA ligase C-terminal domain-containing protein [Candidatus Paceibacterota bacterium]MDD5555081.1 His/Gly/Thr/Pro-type tRNA ligase C-terminal domain-containing protein [Candidatus Paceibacterota bacterium]
MRQTELFSKTFKENPKDEKSLNAQLLIRAGFVDKLSSGIYSFLPLGLRVIKNIEKIVREEMDKIGAQEILMPVLHPKENWEITKRWGVEEMFKIRDEELGLGWTHEEIAAPLMKKHILSYKDLPKYVYQIQVKFRNEPRAKSGILRGKEFIMKDLYSFHDSEDDLIQYYEKVKKAYANVWERCGIKEKTYLTLASGGSFSKYSHEFQTVTLSGEDTIYICQSCGTAINKEINEGTCPNCGNESLNEAKSIEVGNIFKLGAKYSEPFNLRDEKGRPILMGCYGLGISRLMGAIVEVSSDEKGIIWPVSVAPFSIHLLLLDDGNKKKADEVYEVLQKGNFEVLYDDRTDKTAGEKFNDCDLMGIPLRMVVSKKTGDDMVEIRGRKDKEIKLVKIKELMKNVEGFFQ